MSYQVLARKLRPGTFDALIGQDHVVRALRHALDHDQLHHAYLFTGTRGVGKTTIARVLAKCLNCETGVSSTPCEACSVCLEVAENRFVDLIEVDAASRTRVDDTRDLLENAQYLPTRGRYKVYLIDEVHMLSASSFNALLKTLEEPPEHVKFLLATTDPKKVPVTVLSRCLQFQLKNITAERTAEYLAGVLSEEGVEFDAAALTVIGRAARGSMRDALSITDQAIAYGQGRLRGTEVSEMLGVVGRDEVGALLDGLARADAPALLSAVAELAERAVDFEALLEELLGELHQMAVALATGGIVSVSERPDVDRAAFYTPELVQLFYQIGLMGYRDLKIAPDPRCGLEMTLLRMLAFEPEGNSSRVPRSDGALDDASNTQSGAAVTAEVSKAQKTDARSIAAQPDETQRYEAQGNEAQGDVAQPSVVSAEAEPPRVELPDEVQRARQPRRVPDRVASKPPAGAGSVGAQWHDTVARLELGGVARMIAEHSMLVEHEGHRLRLVLDNAHDTLLNDNQIRVISRALASYHGHEVELQITPGVIEVETPAERRERLAAERQHDAEQALQTDDTVQTLLSEFDGTLDSVMPLDASQSK